MAKLNREQKFNQDFVRMIQSHKCLYDTTAMDYRQRDLYEQAWQDVSRKCGESVPACRRRWRNLKTSTCRYLKQLQTAKGKDSSEPKPYYLYKDMKFVIPFLKSKADADESDESILHDSTKSRPSFVVKQEKKSKEERTSRSTKRKFEEYELITGDEGDFIIQRPGSSCSNEQDVTSIIEIERGPNMVEIAEHAGDSGDESTTHIVQTQKPEEKQSTTFTLAELSTGNASGTEISMDELFLRSLLPDINNMNNDQKRKFKIRVLTLIDEILS